MIGMIVGIDDVAYRYVQLLLDELAHRQGLFGKSQGIDDDGPLRTGYDASSHLRINFALKPIDVLGDTLPLHRTIPKVV